MLDPELRYDDHHHHHHDQYNSASKKGILHLDQTATVGGYWWSIFQFQECILDAFLFQLRLNSAIIFVSTF